MSVSAVLVSHGNAAELEQALPALLPQVDEAVVVANVPGSVGSVPEGVRVLHNERPRSFAANVNLGAAATAAEWILVANPDATAGPGVVEALRAWGEAHGRAGILGPQLRSPNGAWQPSRRRFPTVLGTLVRRTPLRRLFPPLRRQREHYGLEERPGEPVRADWVLGGFMLLRRSMLDELGGMDAGFRMYGEDIDLCYRAARAGWETWYVPGATATHRWDAVTDRRFLTRRTLWHWRGILRFVRKHPERLRALR